MSKEELKTLIDTKIVENENGDITATDLNTILNGVIDVSTKSNVFDVYIGWDDDTESYTFRYEGILDEMHPVIFSHAEDFHRLDLPDLHYVYAESEDHIDVNDFELYSLSILEKCPEINIDDVKYIASLSYFSYYSITVLVACDSNKNVIAMCLKIY